MTFVQLVVPKILAHSWLWWYADLWWYTTHAAEDLQGLEEWSDICSETQMQPDAGWRNINDLHNSIPSYSWKSGVSEETSDVWQAADTFTPSQLKTLVWINWLYNYTIYTSLEEINHFPTWNCSNEATFHTSGLVYFEIGTLIVSRLSLNIFIMSNCKSN